MEALPKPRVTVIVPCYNEEDVLEASYARLDVVTQGLEDYAFTFLFVDDGSRDGTHRILASLAEQDKRVQVATLSRNFGHQVAITAGLDLCGGDLFIVIDADLQDPPELIPEMLERLDQGYDLVHMIREDRQVDSFSKRVSARLFYWVMRRFVMSELPENAGDFKGFNRAVLEAVRQYHERVRFLRGIFAGLGFKQTEIAYTRDVRHAGRSKYPLWRVLQFATDAVLSYSPLPLRVFLWTGALACVGSVLFAIVCVALWCTLGRGVDAKFATLVTLIGGLGGLVLVALGIVGEYLGRIFVELKGRPFYIVRETRNLAGNAGGDGPPR